MSHHKITSHNISGTKQPSPRRHHSGSPGKPPRRSPRPMTEVPVTIICPRRTIGTMALLHVLCSTVTRAALYSNSGICKGRGGRGLVGTFFEHIISYQNLSYSF